MRRRRAEVTLHNLTKEGIGESVGTVKIDETAYGLTFTPALSHLPAGIHGFHVHANGSCEPAVTDGKPYRAARRAGTSDPQNSGKHLGPRAEGHLGDLRRSTSHRMAVPTIPFWRRV